MKFLQEMIANKRASQEGLEDEISSDMADDGVEAMTEAQADAAFGSEDLEEHEMQHENEDFEDEADGSDDDLFDDDSYDWEFEGAETADLSEAPVAREPAAAEDNDYEDEDDIDAGVANVLREVAGQTQRPSLPEPGEPAVASRLEENVERLRIQRKIWDLEETEAETAASAGAELTDEASDEFHAETDDDDMVGFAEDASDDLDGYDDDHSDVEMEDDNFEDNLTSALEEEFDDDAEDAFDMNSDEDDGEPVETAAAAAGVLPPSGARVQSKAELRREPAVRREQAQPSRAAGQDGSEKAQDEAPKRRAGRVKTRLLGFHKPEDKPSDPFAAVAASGSSEEETVAPIDPQFPVGWLIVLEGPGRGASFTLTAGVSKVGRGRDQAIRLDYGDTSISRDNHAAIAYDDEQRTFFIGHGGKANLVRLNDMPVLSTETLTDGDLIRIGETMLRFISLCGPEFSWESEGEADSPHEAAE